MRKSLLLIRLPLLSPTIALLSVFPAAALVGGASQASDAIARYVVMVVGSDKTFCSGVVIARDLILTAAQCIHRATNYGIIGFDAPKTVKSVARTTLHPDWDPNAISRHRVTANVALLKLAAPLPPAYTPVALADEKMVTVGSQVIVAGYGVTVIGNGKTGGTLHAAHLLVTGKPGHFKSVWLIQIREVNWLGLAPATATPVGQS
jgi:hypothetical protein